MRGVPASTIGSVAGSSAAQLARAPASRQRVAVDVAHDPDRSRMRAVGVEQARLLGALAGRSAAVSSCVLAQNRGYSQIVQPPSITMGLAGR